ncbi:MAG: hypothetical protein KTR25_15170 [Myxococcales bacterium]|nr:hypothetical protein [Myxococcales bacterium]
MMIAAWGATIGLLVAQIETDAQVGVSLLQRVGTIPTGTVDPNNPGNVDSSLAYDTELNPQVRLQAANSRWLLSVGYEPRLLLRVQELSDSSGSFSALEADEGRPFLVRHGVDSQVRYLIRPLWTWTLNGRVLTGEQDYQTVANNGLGVPIGGGTAGGGADGPQAPVSSGGGTVRSPVIRSTAFAVDTGLTAPLWDRHELQMRASWSLTLSPDDNGILAVGNDAPPLGADDEVLCVLDRESSESQPVAFADTCQILTEVGVELNFSELDSILIATSYSAVDFDPGPFNHVAKLSSTWKHSWSRTGAWRLGLGMVVAVQEGAIGLLNADQDNTEDQPSSSTDTSILPVALAGVEWALIQKRLLRLSVDIGLSVDGFADPTLQEYYSQSTGTIIFRTQVGRDFLGSLAFQGSTVAIERSTPPVDVTGLNRNDLSTLSAGLTLGWQLSEQFRLTGNGSFSTRGPHLAQLGDVGFSQEQATVSIGLAWLYGTRDNKGIGRQPDAK